MYKLLTGRITVLFLLISQLLAIFATVLIPQRNQFTPDQLKHWQESHHWFSHLANILGLNHVFGTIWFWLLLLLFSLSLINSLIYQFRNTKPYKRSSPINFRRWGGIFLHLGILITIIAAIIFSTTRQNALLKLYSGEIHTPKDAWDYTESGVFANNLILPGKLKMEYINTELWPSGQLKQITSRILYQNNNKSRYINLSINTPVSINNIRLYQLHDFGKSFFVTFKGENTTHQLNLPIKYPNQKSGWGYGNFDVAKIPYKIKAKYKINSSDKKVSLVIRLLRKNKVIDQIELSQNESGKLGPYTVTLNDVQDWTAIMAVRSPGMIMIFVGFALLLIGSLCLYLPL